MKTTRHDVPENLFVESIKDIDKSRLLPRASLELADLTAAVMAHGGSGSLVLTIKVKHLPNIGNAVELKGEVKTSKPKPATKSRILYATPEGLLSTSDPDADQSELPFSERAPVLDGAAAPAIEASKKKKSAS